jgi:hypothetical protein
VYFNPFLLLDLIPVLDKVLLLIVKFLGLILKVHLNEFFCGFVCVTETQGSLNDNYLFNKDSYSEVGSLGEDHSPPGLDFDAGNSLPHRSNKPFHCIPYCFLNYILTSHTVYHLFKFWLSELLCKKCYFLPIDLHLFYSKILTKDL